MSAGPDLTKLVDKRLSVKLNGKRRVEGTLRGFDEFMNLVLEGSVEVVSEQERNDIGTVVIRGNCVLMLESLEKVL